MTEIIPASETERAHAATVAALRNGELAVVPTDTSYALIADAFQPLATRRVFDAKRRTRHLPLPVVVRSPRQAIGLVQGFSEPAERLMASYWPGPVTLVLSAVEGLTWDLGETRGSVMLRMPADEFLTALVHEIGPLVCTGANVAGSAVPRTAAEAAEQLGQAVSVVIDGGPRHEAVSTVVDARQAQAVVLREGAVSVADIAQVATGEVGWGMRPRTAPSGSPDGAESPEESLAAPPAPTQE